VVADFGGGGITSDAGVPLLSEADKRLPLIERIAAQCDAPRCKGHLLKASRTCCHNVFTPWPWATKTSTTIRRLNKDTALQTAEGGDTDLTSTIDGLSTPGDQSVRSQLI
jgi:hypothetical protein